MRAISFFIKVFNVKKTKFCEQSGHKKDIVLNRKNGGITQVETCLTLISMRDRERDRDREAVSLSKPQVSGGQTSFRFICQ